MAQNDIGASLLGGQFLPVMSKVASADPVLGRMVLDANEWLIKIAQRESKERHGYSDTGNTLQAEEGEVDSLFTLFLQMAMHVKPSSKPQLQRHLPACSARMPATDRAFVDSTAHSSLSHTDAIATAAADTEMSSSSSTRRRRLSNVSDSSRADARPLPAVVEEDDSSTNGVVGSNASHEQRDLSAPEQPRPNQRMAPGQMGEASAAQQKVEAAGSVNGEGEHESDISSSLSTPPESPSLISDRASEDLSVCVRQPSVTKEYSEDATGRTASSQRFTVRKANSKISSAKGRIDSTSKRKGKISGTTVDGPLNAIAMKLGGIEVQSAIREATTPTGEPQSTFQPGMKLYDQVHQSSTKMSRFASLVRSLAKNPSSQWINAAMYRFDVAFYHRFYLSANQDAARAHRAHSPSVFLTESAALLKSLNYQVS